MLKRIDTQNWSDKQSWYRDIYFQDTDTKAAMRIQIRWDKSYPLQCYGKSEFLTKSGWKLLYQIPPTDVIGLDVVEIRLFEKSKSLLCIGEEEFNMDIANLLDELDGSGIIITDPNLLEETLESLGLHLDSELEVAEDTEGGYDLSEYEEK
jgi:hypothetical protein